jgi:catalase
MPADAKERLIANIVGSMKSVPRHIPELQIQHFYKADPAYRNRRGERAGAGRGSDY